MKTILVFAAAAAAFGLAACDPDNGEVDVTPDSAATNATEQVGEAVEDTGDAIENAADKTGDALQEAGADAKDAVTPDAKEAH